MPRPKKNRDDPTWYHLKLLPLHDNQLTLIAKTMGEKKAELACKLLVDALEVLVQKLKEEKLWKI